MQCADIDIYPFLPDHKLPARSSLADACGRDVPPPLPQPVQQPPIAPPPIPLPLRSQAPPSAPPPLQQQHSPIMHSSMTPQHPHPPLPLRLPPQAPQPPPPLPQPAQTIPRVSHAQPLQLLCKDGVGEAGVGPQTMARRRRLDELTLDPRLGSSSAVEERVLRLTSEGARSFEFESNDGGGVRCGWRELWDQLRQLEGGAPLADEAWFQNHYRWIAWKLACQHRSLQHIVGSRGFSAEAVLKQLRHRYDRELVRTELPVLRRICEGDETPATHMVLCIAAADAASSSLELTDGWYSVWAKCDAPLTKQLVRGRLRVGLKLRLCGSSRIGDASDHGRPWQLEHSAAAPRLQLNANGTRRAQWHCKLGRCRTNAFRVGVDSLQEGGGQAPVLEVRVVRVFGPLVFLPREEGGNAWLTLPHFEDLQRREEEAQRARHEHADLKRDSRADGRKGAKDDGGEDDGDDDDEGDPQRAVDLSAARLTWKLLLLDAGGGVAGGRLAEYAMWGAAGDVEERPVEGGMGRLLGAEVGEHQRASFGNERLLSLKIKCAPHRAPTARPLCSPAPFLTARPRPHPLPPCSICHPPAHPVSHF